MLNDIKKIINMFKELINIIELELPEKYKIEAFRILATRYLEKQHLASIEYPEERPLEASPREKEAITFGEFVSSLSKEPKNNMERLTILVYYLTSYANPDTKFVKLDKELVEQYFGEVGWKIPANLRRDLKDAIRKRKYLAISNKGVYLVKPGREYVERLLAGEGVKEYGKS